MRNIFIREMQLDNELFNGRKWRTRCKLFLCATFLEEKYSSLMLVQAALHWKEMEDNLNPRRKILH